MKALAIIRTIPAGDFILAAVSALSLWIVAAGLAVIL